MRYVVCRITLEEAKKMKIKRAQPENGSEEILELLGEGVDIVIVEYPKAIVLEEGSRCHVFVRGKNKSFVNKLDDIPGWIKVSPLDQLLAVCLYSLSDYERTVEAIKKTFPDITFEVVE